MLGIDGLCATPSLEGFEEGDYETPGDYKRKRRQSVGGKWSWQSHLWRYGNLLLPEMCFHIKNPPVAFLNLLACMVFPPSVSSGLLCSFSLCLLCSVTKYL